MTNGYSRLATLGLASALVVLHAGVAAAGDADLEDRVETIDQSATTATAVPAVATPSRAPAAPPAASPRPPSSGLSPAVTTPERFELHGWARQSLELGLGKRVPAAGESDRTTPPYDQLAATSQMFIRARYSRGRWFEANVSGAVSYSVFEAAPARASTPFDGLSGGTVDGVVEPRLYEAFVGLFSPQFDVRIGQQRVAWGNAEFLSPNDVMNARDLRDPFLSETEMRSLPTLMLRADLDLGFATLQGIVEPAFTPDRYDIYGSNWAAVQPDAPVWARGLANLAGRSLDPTLQEPAQRLLAATRYPKSDFTAPVVGARLSWSAGGVDVNYYYQFGFDGPFLEIDPMFAASLASLDYDTVGLADLQPWLSAIDAGKTPLSVSFVRRHHVGMDLATTLGPIALRLDAAFQSKRVLSRRDLVGFVSPSVQGVMSVEYQTGEKDKFALLEVVYTHLVDTPVVPLLVYDRNTVGLVADLRWPLWSALGFELRGLIGVRPKTATVQPELNLNFGRWVIGLGGLWLDGEPYSLGSHFHRNLEAYSKVKLLF